MRGLPFDIEKGARPSCYTCFRPIGYCLCQLITPFAAHCNVLILQHPNERKKYNSTAKLVTRALTNAKVLRGLIFDQQQLEQALAGQKTFLLFPGKEAQDCETLPLGLDNTVIVLDGTWSEAAKVLRRNPILKQFPTVSFKAPLRSKFYIRRQPKDHYLSTIESIAHLLKLSAAASGQKSKAEEYDRLLQTFDRMVEQQLSFFPRNRNKLTPQSQTV